MSLIVNLRHFYFNVEWCIIFPMIKAVLCDLDGTLLATTKDIKLALETALGSTFDDREVDRFVGNGLRNAVRAALRCKGMSENETDHYYEALLECYEKVPVRYTRPFGGIPEMLSALKKNGIVIGIFSNKQQSILDKVVDICLSDYSIGFVIGRGGPYKAKPDPEAVFAFCEYAGCTTDELLYLGDSEVDYRCAQSASVRALIFDWGTRIREELIGSEVPQSSIISSTDRVLEEVFG